MRCALPTCYACARSTLSTHYSVPALLTTRWPLYSLAGARSTHSTQCTSTRCRCTAPTPCACTASYLLTYLLTVLTILTMRRVACAAHELRGKLLLYLLHLLYLPWQSKAPAKDVTIKYK